MSVCSETVCATFSRLGGALKKITSPTRGLKGPIGTVRVTRTTFPGSSAGTMDGEGTETN